MTDDMNAQTSSVATTRPSDGATSKKRKHNFTPVSYTHLTLPTILLV